MKWVIVRRSFYEWQSCMQTMTWLHAGRSLDDAADCFG